MLKRVCEEEKELLINVDRREYNDLVELVKIQNRELREARSQIDQLKLCLQLTYQKTASTTPMKSECLLVNDQLGKAKEPTVYVDLEDVSKLDPDVSVQYCSKLK